MCSRCCDDQHRYPMSCWLRLSKLIWFWSSKYKALCKSEWIIGLIKDIIDIDLVLERSADMCEVSKRGRKSVELPEELLKLFHSVVDFWKQYALCPSHITEQKPVWMGKQHLTEKKSSTTQTVKTEQNNLFSQNLKTRPGREKIRQFKLIHVSATNWHC